MELFGLIALVLAIILFVQNKKMHARLDHIEKYLAEATRGLVPSGEPNVPPTAVADHSLLQGEQASVREGVAWQPPVASSEPGALERFIAWCKEDWLMKVGGLLVILGAAWFVSFAVAQGWIGEMGRITLAFMAGAVVLGLGWYRIQRYVTQGSVLLFVGAVTIVMTMFAARELYGFFNPYFALLVMFLASAVLGAASIIFKERPLALANVLLAGIAPLLVAAPSTSLAMLFLYLLVVTIGALWVTAITGWRILPFLSLIIIGLYSIGEIEKRWWMSPELDTGLLFAYVFTALFFAVSILGMRVARKASIIDLLTALGIGGFLLMWILVAAAPGVSYTQTIYGYPNEVATTGNDWRSLLLMAWTVVFAWGAFLAVRWGAPLSYFYSYLAVGVTYLGAATMLELDGAVRTLALAIEAAALLAVGYRVTGRVQSIPLLAVPSIVPLLMSLESVVAYEWRDSVFHVHALVLILITLISAGVAYAFGDEKGKRPADDSEGLEDVEHVGYVIAGLYGLTLIWLITHALFLKDATGTFVALTIYTMIAAVFYIAGKISAAKWQRVVAGILFGGVVMRLLFVEARFMPQGMRILTFFIIGGLAIGVAWIERSAVRARVPQDPNA